MTYLQAWGVARKRRLGYTAGVEWEPTLLHVQSSALRQAMQDRIQGLLLQQIISVSHCLVELAAVILRSRPQTVVSNS